MLARSRHTLAPTRGFTLIELLVVIAIIGLLSAIVLASLNVARNKAYDSTRFNDLRQMQTILDTYYTDHGSYPVGIAADVGQINPHLLHRYSVCGAPFTTVAQNSVVTNLGTTLVSLGYISAIPVGPQMNAATIVDCYVYSSNGIDYKFEDYNPGQYTSNWANPATKSFIDPDEGTAVAWSVYSPGAALWP